MRLPIVDNIPTSNVRICPFIYVMMIVLAELDEQRSWKTWRSCAKKICLDQASVETKTKMLGVIL